jgi:acyl carrier protein
LDRASLPDPETAQSEVRQYVPPQTVTEAAVANIWAEVFKRDRIGVTDDFFRIGGHSLLATQVISRVREQFRVEIAMQTLFESPNIQALSRAIDEAPEAEIVEDEPAIVPVSRDAYRQRS